MSNQIIAFVTRTVIAVINTVFAVGIIFVAIVTFDVVSSPRNEIQGNIFEHSQYDAVVLQNAHCKVSDHEISHCDFSACGGINHTQVSDLASYLARLRECAKDRPDAG